MALYGLSRPLAAGSASLMLIGWAVGAPVIGWLSDRVASRKYPVMGAAALAAGSFSTLILVDSLPLLVAETMLLLNGVACGGMVVLFAATRENNAAEASGAAVSLVNAAVMVSGAVLQPVIGWMLDLQWDGSKEAGARIYSVTAYETAFLTLVFSSLLAAVLCLFIRERRDEPARR